LPIEGSWATIVMAKVRRGPLARPQSDPAHS
jgi:hypothetical protein